MKLAFVIQRYGLEVNGGAELHCRWLAERLAQQHEVEILTTCARDYVTWENYYPQGSVLVNGIQVTRFRNRKKRNERAFARLSNLVFYDSHSLKDETAWIKENGPYCPQLIKEIKRRASQFDCFLFYCFRYYQSYHGLPAVASKAILIPTAEEDPAVHLKIFIPFFKLPRAILYLTPEERRLVTDAAGTESIPASEIGSGINTPQGVLPDIRTQLGIPGRFILYVGRIDRNKGCPELFAYFKKFCHDIDDSISLVLAGGNVIPVPDHPRIKHLGFISEEEKFAVLKECDLLVVPSKYESLSVVLLEGWSCGKPALVNARCAPLKGQCLRSNGGLFYRGYAEFEEALKVLLTNSALAAKLGLNGKHYVEQEYAWPVVCAKVNSMLALLKEEIIGPRS